MSLLPSGWRPYLPLTLQIIAHPVVERNRQNTQNWDFYLAIICATFLLTNCWQCGIMKIPATVGCGRRAKIKEKGVAKYHPLIIVDYNISLHRLNRKIHGERPQLSSGEIHREDFVVHLRAESATPVHHHVKPDFIGMGFSMHILGQSAL